MNIKQRLWGKVIEKTVNDKEWGIEKISKIFSLIITIIVFFICYRHSYMLYMTNDDTGIQNLLNGFTTGVNDPAHQFINIILGCIMAILYYIIPSIQWWFVYSQFLMLVGIFMINYVMISICTYRCRALARIGACVKTRMAIQILILLGIVVIFNISFSIPAISSTSFTVVPAIYGVGIVSLLFLFGYQDRINNRVLGIILVAFLPVVFHRKSTAYAVLAYLILVCMWGLTTNIERRHALKKLAIWTIIAVIVFEAFVIIDDIYKKYINGADFYEFNTSRAELLDHSRDSYDDNPELYNTVCWDRDTYVMVSNWCFVDDRCTAESMHYIASNGNAKKDSSFKIIASIFTDSKTRNLTFIFGFLMVVAFCSLWVHRAKTGMVFLIVDFLGALIMVTYQIITGRVVYRSLVVVLLPASVVMILLMFSEGNNKNIYVSGGTWGQIDVHIIKSKIIRFILIGVMVLSLISALISSVLVTKNFVNMNEIRTNVYIDNDDTIHRYLIKHKENFYVMQIGMKSNINPRLLYNDDISNLFYWGGADYHSHTRKYLLQKNGLSGLDDEAFLKNNVYLISSVTYSANENDYFKEELEKNNEVYAFCHWMSTLHPEYEMVQTDEIFEGMNVYKFVMKE